MQEELKEINDKFQRGQHKQAINELQTVIEKCSTDDLVYKAHDRLGDYLNFLGEHVQAVESWNNALKILESNPGGIDQLNEQKFFDWLNISLEIARITHRQGIDGPGVSHKYNSVRYSSSKLSDTEKEEWKNKHLQTAIAHYKRVLNKLPAVQLETKRKIQTKLAQVLFDAKNYDEAVPLYEIAFNNDGNPAWLYKAACCSWEQGNKEQAYTRLEQLIATEPTFAQAYKMFADYFQEKNDTVKVEECNRKYRFYSWIPRFCQNIEYNTENVSILEQLESEEAFNCVETILATEKSKRSTEFLASICYHHYHGPVETKAFEILEQRGKDSEGDERDFIGSMLTYLIKNNRSICTIKGAANFNLFPMHIPAALAKLHDERAIPLLIKLIEKKSNEIETNDNGNDSDSSDDIFSAGGSDRLIFESRIALASFINDNRAKEALINEINNKTIGQNCLAILCVATEDKQYFEQLQKMFSQEHTLHYTVIEYLQDNLDQSQYANKILDYNKELSAKKTSAVENVDD